MDNYFCLVSLLILSVIAASLKEIDWSNENKCPSCKNGIVWDAEYGKWFICSRCGGTGIK